MTEISQFSAFTTVSPSDLLLGVDVDDTSMASTGTTKKITVGTLLKEVIVPTATGVSATDTANIGAAVTAAGIGGFVYFPYGTYIADSLTPLNGQTWYGPATIKQTTGSANPVINGTGLTGWTIRDLTIDGDRAGSTSTYQAAIDLVNTTWCRFLGITVQNTAAGSAGISLEGAVRCLIDSCQFYNCGYAVVAGLVLSDGYSCYGNVINGCTIDTTDHDGIFLSENLASTVPATVTGLCVDNIISNCVIRNAGDGGIELGSGCVQCTIVGCIVDGTGTAGSNGIYLRDAVHCNVTDCMITNVAGYGVQLFSLNSYSHHCTITSTDVYNTGLSGYNIEGSPDDTNFAVAAAADIAISGGTVDGCGTSSGDNMRICNVQGFTISDMLIHGAGGQGIGIGKSGNAAASSSDGLITGCRIVNSAQVLSTANGIDIFQNGANIAIRGCRITDTQVTKTQVRGVVIADATVSNITVSDNDLTGNKTSAVSNASTTGIKFFRNNGYNPVGATTVTPASSPWTYTAGSTPEQLYLAGGTVSNVSKNSVTLPYSASAGSTYALEPGESIVVTYSGVPTTAVADRK